MSAKTKGMIIDANGIRPDQYYDPNLDEYVVVTRQTPYPIVVLPKHKGFMASQGVLGWYVLEKDNELIEFEKPLNSIQIESRDTALAIKINDDPSIWYIDPNSVDGLEDIEVRKITVLNATGTPIRWRGLYL